MRQVADPLGGLGDRRAQLLGAEPRDADRQVGLAHRLPLQLVDPAGAARPVLRVVVDVEVDLLVGADQVAEVEVMRIGHHQHRAGRHAPAPPPVRGSTGRSAASPAAGTASSSRWARPGRAARGRARAAVSARPQAQGGIASPPGVVVVEALEQEGRDVVAARPRGTGSRSCTSWRRRPPSAPSRFDGRSVPDVAGEEMVAITVPSPMCGFPAGVGRPSPRASLRFRPTQPRRSRPRCGRGRKHRIRPA